MSTFHGFEDIPVLGNLPPEQGLIKLRGVEEAELPTSDSFVRSRSISSPIPEQGEEAEKRAIDSHVKSRSVSPPIPAEAAHKRWWHFLKRSSEKSGDQASTVAPTLKNENRKGWRIFSEKAWLHTAHAFGYIAPAIEGNDSLPILSVSAAPADLSLKNSRLNIRLERIRLVSYPGQGIHRVLLHFFSQNQVRDKKENIHFNIAYRVREGELDAILGYPIFVGIASSEEGLPLSCRTIEVNNDQDEAFLDIFESDAFKAGLLLTPTTQPTIALLSTINLGIARAIAKRDRNISVQDFVLDLHFSDFMIGAHLAEGNYLVVQIPGSQMLWDWDEWVYLCGSGQVVKRNDHQQRLPYNYLILGVSRYQKPSSF